MVKLIALNNEYYNLEVHAMDKIDKKIITLLQQNARMPLKALAENVFLSSPAVSARIERLEKEEIIEGYEVKINQLKLGALSFTHLAN